MIRLQGQIFRDMKPLLKMLGYDISNNGNIRAVMKHKYNGKRFTHWLNEREKERFLQSNYYKNHKPGEYKNRGK